MGLSLTESECRRLSRRRRTNAYGDKDPFPGMVRGYHTPNSVKPDVPVGWEIVVVRFWGWMLRRVSDRQSFDYNGITYHVSSPLRSSGEMGTQPSAKRL